ncbi:850_t:CDS:2 [Paraglomus occultum]|uniref:850_t:CDS:1 n=1 Tax=Paraglomus occultum TaxID=144539 RepID=A0A9N9FQW0_9GLOM|nr:850_t:CDS:2 [Paraglomus occultum]
MSSTTRAPQQSKMSSAEMLSIFASVPNSMFESTPKRPRKRESAPVGPKTKRSRVSKDKGLLDNVEDLFELSKRQQTREKLWKWLDEDDTKDDMYISDGDMKVEGKHVRRRRKETIDQQPTVLEDYVERPGKERGKKFRKQRIKGDFVDKDPDDVTIEYIPNNFEGIPEIKFESARAEFKKFKY